MDECDLKQYLSDKPLNHHSDLDDFDEMFHQFLETHNSCSERPYHAEISLPLTPPFESSPTTQFLADVNCITNNNRLVQSESEDLNDLVRQILETHSNTGQNTSSAVESPLSFYRTDSCPEISIARGNEDCLENYKTNTPELEKYLRKLSPVKHNATKRKSDRLLQRNRKPKVIKRTTSSDVEQIDAIPCTEKSMKWENFHGENLHKLYDSSFTERKPPFLSVTCDKGISLSPTESIYISQKKNHFQITMALRNAPETDCFIKLKDKESYEEVFSYKVHLYAVKAESPSSKITIEQSTADRCKHQYHPVRFPSEDREGTRTLTVGRLHFCETTANNMRKKGKLNPDQRYFLLVVDVRAYTKQGIYPICCQAGEKIVVRATNPGQFETETSYWFKGRSDDSIYRMGNVGINNEKPEHSLSVNGDFLLTGQILQPADGRLVDFKEKVDTSQNLENLAKLNIYKYEQNKEYMQYGGSDPDKIKETVGVLGNEVKKIIPDAVTRKSNITLPGGKGLKDVLLIDKDRLLMESIGALQELYKTAQLLTSRLTDLERKINKLNELQTNGS